MNTHFHREHSRMFGRRSEGQEIQHNSQSTYGDITTHGDELNDGHDGMGVGGREDDRVDGGGAADGARGTSDDGGAEVLMDGNVGASMVDVGSSGGGSNSVARARGRPHPAPGRPLDRKGGQEGQAGHAGGTRSAEDADESELRRHRKPRNKKSIAVATGNHKCGEAEWHDTNTRANGGRNGGWDASDGGPSPLRPRGGERKNRHYSGLTRKGNRGRAWEEYVYGKNGRHANFLRCRSCFSLSEVYCGLINKCVVHRWEKLKRASRSSVGAASRSDRVKTAATIKSIAVGEALFTLPRKSSTRKRALFLIRKSIAE